MTHQLALPTDLFKGLSHAEALNLASMQRTVNAYTERLKAKAVRVKVHASRQNGHTAETWGGDIYVTRDLLGDSTVITDYILAHEMGHIKNHDSAWFRLTACIFALGLLASAALFVSMLLSPFGWKAMLNETMPLPFSPLACVPFLLLLVLKEATMTLEWRADTVGATLIGATGMIEGVRATAPFRTDVNSRVRNASKVAKLRNKRAKWFVGRPEARGKTLQQ